MRLVVALVVGVCWLCAACAAPAAPAVPRTEAAPAAAEPRPAAAPAAAAAGPQAREPVKLGYASLSVANAGLFTAADGGMFERNGLEPELILMGAGQTSEAGLLSGQIPAVSASPISALNAVLGGGDVVVVGAVLDLVTYQIIGGPEVASLGDLRGKTIAINRLGGSPHSALRLMMATAGVDLDREVQVLQAGAQLERIAAVRHGPPPPGLARVGGARGRGPGPGGAGAPGGPPAGADRRPPQRRRPAPPGRAAVRPAGRERGAAPGGGQRGHADRLPRDRAEREPPV